MTPEQRAAVQRARARNKVHRGSRRVSKHPEHYVVERDGTVGEVDLDLPLTHPNCRCELPRGMDMPPHGKDWSEHCADLRRELTRVRLDNRRAFWNGVKVGAFIVFLLAGALCSIL